MFSSFMSACSAIVTIYTLLIIARIITSWFAFSGWRSDAAVRIMNFIERITDPYLAFFRRFGFFRLGSLDFSPVVALITLSVLGNIFMALAAYERITFGLVLALFLVRFWAAAAFFLNIFIFLIALRLAAYFMRINPAGPFWSYLDMILTPLLEPIARLIFRRRIVPYMPTGHIAGGLFLLAVRLLGSLLAEKLGMFIGSLPF